MFKKNYAASFIKGFDFFGESFTFKIRQRKYYTSIVGGLTSLGFTIYSLYYFIANLTDFFGKNNRSIENEIKSVSEPSINFSDHDYFKMAFCIRDDSMAIDQKITKSLIMQSHLIDNKLENKRLNSQSKEMMMENCSEEYLNGVFADLYKLKDFDGCKCLKFSSSEDKLRSKYNIIDREYLQVEMKFDSKDNRVNVTEMSNYLEMADSKLFIYFPSYSIDVTNSQDPLKMNVHTVIYEMKPYISQKAEIWLSVFNFTDYNSLYNEESSTQMSRLSFDTSDVVSYANNLSSDNSDKHFFQSFFKFRLGLSMRSVNYTRKVLQYDDFLGNMVGYLSNIIIILYVFNVIYNSFGARVYFAEKFFMKNNNLQAQVIEELKKKLNLAEVNVNLDENSGSDNKNIQNIQNSQENYNSHIKQNENREFFALADEKPVTNQLRLEIDSRNVNLDNNKLNLNSITPFSPKRNLYNYNFFEYCLYSFFCCNCNRDKRNMIKAKSELLDNSDNFYDYYLDINTYIKKMIEIDIIKLLLFKDKEDLAVIDKFTPVLKRDYADSYAEKINHSYKNKVNSDEWQDFLVSIREMKTSDSRLYKLLLSYYE